MTEEIYEVRLGEKILGQFSSAAKAKSFAKTVKEGKPRIIHRYVEVKKAKKETPKPVKPKEKPKVKHEKPKVKIEPKPKKEIKPVKPKAEKPKKESPKPIKPEKPPAPKKQPKITTRKPMTNIQFAKKLNDALSMVNLTEVPVFSSRFSVVDPAHVLLVKLNNRNGQSLFGMNGGNDDIFIDLDKLLKESNGEFEFDEMGNAITKSGMINAEMRGWKSEPKINIDYDETYTVDAVAFKTELARIDKIVGKRWDVTARLYGHNGDLMMSSRNEFNYGMRVDVGDGQGDKGSFFPVEYLKVLSKIMLLSDTPCRLSIGEDYPLMMECASGDWDITVFLAPRIEGD